MKTLIALLLLTAPASAKMWVTNDLASAEANGGIIAIFSDGDGYRLENNEHTYRCEVDGAGLSCDRPFMARRIEFLTDGSIRLDGEIFTLSDE